MNILNRIIVINNHVKISFCYRGKKVCKPPETHFVSIFNFLSI